MFRNYYHRFGVRLGGLLFSIAFTLTSLFPLTVSGQGTIEEILVTARKREENLQDIPLTVSAFTEAALEERGITSLQDIADFTPGFDFAQAFGRQDFRPSIRGQSNILGRANAGLFLEGIIIEAGNASVPLSALERVEVVKGPQSALYGRSTLAGAVNYVLKKPGDEFQGEVQAEYGERDQVRVDLHAGGPVSDAMGIAVTASHYERDGEYDNSYPGNALGTPAIDDEVGGEESTSVAAVLSLNPTEQFSLTGHMIYEDTDDDHYAIAMQPSGFNNCFQVTRGGPLTQPLPPAGTPEAGAILVGSAGYNGSGYYCGRVDVDDVLEASGGGNDTNLETSFFDDSGVERESLRLGVKLDFDLTDAFTFTSVTGYNDVDTEARTDRTFGGGDTRFPVVGIGSPFFVQPFGAPPSVVSRVGFITDVRSQFDDFSQEIRLSYDAGLRMRHMIGFYYYESDFAETQITSFDTTTSVSTRGVPVFSPFNPRFIPATISTSAFYEGAAPRDNGREEIESWSVFGSLEFDFTDKLTVGTEFRYNEDDFEITPAGADESAEGSFNAFLPKVFAKYQATDRLLVYANIAKGNKPGTLNTDQGVPATDLEVDEETAWNFELGIKSAWMDNRVIANAAVYHIDWDDLQLTSTRAATVNGQPRTFSILENVGKATINGIELDLAMSLTDFWDARIAYAWTDSEIDEFIQSVDAGAQAGSAFREAALINGYSPSGDVIITGAQLPQSSKHQLNLSNTFHGNMNGDWSWFLRGDFNYNSKRYAQVYNLAHTGNREIVNLRGGVSNGNFDIEVWVDNVFEDDAPTQLIRYVAARNLSFNPFNRAIGVTLPEKRRVGVTARYRF
ncbi:MAG: TonB-dependent receptor [Gammaproteobacteria bacterium]|nr:TonB-dependent receptor [Gammaproteobacteria bacterium]